MDSVTVAAVADYGTTGAILAGIGYGLWRLVRLVGRRNG